MISIVIPIYNQAKTIGKCLDSIFQQTHKDFEIIIVNDGSTDDFTKVMENYLENCPPTFNNSLRVFNQENKGAPAARNRGFKEAKGEYLFFCDADAVLKTEALEIMLKTLDEHKEASYAYPSFYWGKKIFKLFPFDAEKLKQGPYIHTMALIRREHFPTGGWDESIKKLQDWDLWLTMLEQGRTGIWINAVLFTIKPGGIISSWLPSCAYKLMPFLPSVKKYDAAMAIIKQKHKL